MKTKEEKARYSKRKIVKKNKESNGVQHRSWSYEMKERKRIISSCKFFIFVVSPFSRLFLKLLRFFTVAGTEIQIQFIKENFISSWEILLWRHQSNDLNSKTCESYEMGTFFDSLDKRRKIRSLQKNLMCIFHSSLLNMMMIDWLARIFKTWVEKYCIICESFTFFLRLPSFNVLLTSSSSATSLGFILDFADVFVVFRWRRVFLCKYFTSSLKIVHITFVQPLSGRVKCK